MTTDWKRAFEDEAKKFQQETLRTSELTQMLLRFMRDSAEDGCSADPWVKSCRKCDLMREAKALLEKPINA